MNNLKHIISIVFIFILFSQVSFASSIGKDVKEGNKLYNNKEYDQAMERYMKALEKDPNSDIINYNLGTALYKKNAFDKTIPHFQKSLLTEDEKLKEKTHYNLGNAFYKSGINKEKANINAAVGLLKQSLKEYGKALSLNDKNENALYNHEFVTKELKRLEKEQQQNQQQQNQKDEPQNSDQKDQDQKQDQDPQDQASNEQASNEKQDHQNQDSGQSQQQQKESQLKEKEKEEAKDEASGAQASNDKDQEDQQAGKEASLQEMTREEARMLLEGYRQNEEPDEMLNFQRHRTSERPVLKDW